MKIGVLETGMVGNAIASKPVALGRDVMMGVPHRQHRSRAPRRGHSTRITCAGRARRHRSFVNKAAVHPQDAWFEGTTYEWTRYYEPNIVAGVRVIQIR